MSQRLTPSLSLITALLIAVAMLAPRLAGQSSPRPAAPAAANAGEWPTYGADLANTKYRPLDQINATNFDKLELAWRFRTDNLGPRPEARE